MLQRTLPAGFVRRASDKTTKLPSGSQWLHETKDDGFASLLAQVKLYSLFGQYMTRSPSTARVDSRWQQ
jgi:hypothetical protein